MMALGYRRQTTLLAIFFEPENRWSELIRFTLMIQGKRRLSQVDD
jgi:hypothetical protein